MFAIGTPLSKDFANTLTRGVVSSLRTLDGLAYVQTDVAIDHGNSGGPLIDEQGRSLRRRLVDEPGVAALATARRARRLTER